MSSRGIAPRTSLSGAAPRGRTTYRGAVIASKRLRGAPWPSGGAPLGGPVLMWVFHCRLSMIQGSRVYASPLRYDQSFMLRPLSCGACFVSPLVDHAAIYDRAFCVLYLVGGGCRVFTHAPLTGRPCPRPCWERVPMRGKGAVRYQGRHPACLEPWAPRTRGRPLRGRRLSPAPDPHSPRTGS
jgi:hypothetical protein